VTWETSADSAVEQADVVLAERTAWIVCPLCEHRHSERERVRGVRDGMWVSVGHVPGEHPRAARVGFHISALVSSLGVTIPRLVAQYIRAEAGDVGERFEFRTQVLGLPFDYDVTGDAKGIRKLAQRGAGKRLGFAPEWTAVLLASADTQKGYWQWVVRAWGLDGKSMLVDAGRSDTRDELVGLLSRGYPVLGRGMLPPAILFVDAGGGVARDDEDGSLTQLIFELGALEQRLIPAMGRARVEPPYVRMKEHHRHKQVLSRLLYHQPTFFKDVMVDWVRRGAETPEPFWAIPEDTPDRYFEHFGNARKTETRKGEWSWGRRTPKSAIDLFDAEALNLAGFRFLQTAHGLRAPRQETAEERTERSWIGARGWRV
jgi:hypothetical protein